MHSEILSIQQKKLLPLIKKFSQDFGIVGGTAIALYLGHRQSINFDLFSNKQFDNLKIRNQILKFNSIEEVIADEFEQYSVVMEGVKITFLRFPYQIDFSQNFDDIIKVPDLLTLAALKLYALGRRAKWKDYVDSYFILKRHSLSEIFNKAKIIFGNEFNEKIIRAQLSYFDDIDYSEKIIYLEKFETDDNLIKKNLIEVSISQ